MKDRTIEILLKHLDGDYRVSPMAPSKSMLHDVQGVEEKLGITFPKEYKFHLLGEDDPSLGNRGIYVEVKEDIWPRQKAFDVGPFWSFLYGIHTYTACVESEDWMRLEVVGAEFFENTGLKAVPILTIIGDADCYCINENENIVRYRHEENMLEPVGMNFWDILDLELKELAERKEMKIGGK